MQTLDLIGIFAFGSAVPWWRSAVASTWWGSRSSRWSPRWVAASSATSCSGTHRPTAFTRWQYLMVRGAAARDDPLEQVLQCSGKRSNVLGCADQQRVGRRHLRA